MKNKFVLTLQAEADLFEIWDHIAGNSADNANRVIRQLQEAFQKLAGMPGMGHTREDLADKRHRFWPVHSFLVVYRPETNPLQIIAIVHGARELKAFFAKFDDL